MNKSTIVCLIVAALTGCGKKYHFECHTDVYGQASGVYYKVQKYCTDKSIQRYIDQNSSGNNDNILSEGEKITTCNKL